MPSSDEDSTFWEHVEELRRTFIRCLMVIGAGIAISLYFYQELIHLLTLPLSPTGLDRRTIHHEQLVNIGQTSTIIDLNNRSIKNIRFSDGTIDLGAGKYELPANGSLQYEKTTQSNQLMVLSPIEGLCITLKICCWTGILASSPLWLYFVLQFISPALHHSEKRMIAPFLSLSLLFLTAGFLLAYFVTIPIANQYLALFNESIGANLWTVASYLDYTGLLLLGNGLSFEMGVILLFLVHYGIIGADTLKRKRRHMIVLSFIIGAVLTPPDVLTQFMLAIPLIILYECVILYGSFKERNKEKAPGLLPLLE